MPPGDGVPCGCSQKRLAEWASSPRTARALQSASQRARAGFVVRALLSQDALPAGSYPVLARTCVREGYGKLLMDILDRAVLPARDHRNALSFLMSRYDEFRRAFPRMVNQDLHTCLTVIGLAAVGSEDVLSPCATGSFRDHPAVRRAVIVRVRELIPLPGVNVDELADCLRSLLSSAALTSSELAALQELLLYAGGASDSDDERLKVDLSVSLRNVGCLGTRKGAARKKCVESLKELAGYSGKPLTWTSGVVPFEALMHASEIGEEPCSRILASSSGALVECTASLLAREHADGMEGIAPALALLVEHSGTRVLDTVHDDLAAECVSVLARRGWYALTWSVAVDSKFHHVVADHYQPASALVEDAAYRRLLDDRIGELPREQRDVVESLMSEWVGTFPSLIESAQAMSS